MASTASVLETVLPDIKPVSEAPSRSDLERQADQRGVTIEAVMKEERAKRYKAYNSQTGVVYLVQNPASWERINGVLYRASPEVYAGIKAPSKRSRKAQLDESVF